GSAAGFEPVELVPEVGALGLGCGLGSLAEHGLEVRIASPGPSVFVLAGALVVAGADAGPRSAVTRGRKHRHVRTQLSEHGNRHHPVDPGEGVEALDLL